MFVWLLKVKLQGGMKMPIAKMGVCLEFNELEGFAFGQEAQDTDTGSFGFSVLSSCNCPCRPTPPPPPPRPPGLGSAMQIELV